MGHCHPFRPGSSGRTAGIRADGEVSGHHPPACGSHRGTVRRDLAGGNGVIGALAAVALAGLPHDVLLDPRGDNSAGGSSSLGKEA